MNANVTNKENTEFIPTSSINDIIKSSFKLEDTDILHKYNNSHFIIKTKIEYLLSAPINNWKFNRPPDIVRCIDISRYIYFSKNVVDTMIYLSFNNVSGSFDVIDGIHRYTSLNIIRNENSKPLDLITPGDFGNNLDASWLYESYVVLNIRFNSTEGDLVELFKSLNKSNPIPDLYIRNVNQDKREIIENLCNLWQIEFKTHFSSNNKPNRPNINRDRFIDLLENIYDKYAINYENKGLLEELLRRCNANISLNIPKKLPTKIKEKCEETGLWLFIYNTVELLKLI